MKTQAPRFSCTTPPLPSSPYQVPTKSLPKVSRSFRQPRPPDHFFPPVFEPTSHVPHAESATDHAYCERHFAQFPVPATRHPRIPSPGGMVLIAPAPTARSTGSRPSFAGRVERRRNRFPPVAVRGRGTGLLGGEILPRVVDLRHRARVVGRVLGRLAVLSARHPSDRMPGDDRTGIERQARSEPAGEKRPTTPAAGCAVSSSLPTG